MTILTINFYRYICGISHTRDKDFRKYCPSGFDSKGEKESDEWWREMLLIDSFNKESNNTVTSYFKVGIESTIAIRFWTKAKGNLPHLYYILCKPEPPGK